MTLDWRSAAALPAEVISRERSVQLVNAVWIATLVAAGMLDLALPLPAESLLYTACLVFTLSLVWILASWHWLRGTLFEPYPLFMIAAGLFNGGQPLLEIFGLNRGGMLDGRFAPEILLRSVYLVTVSLIGTHTGALVALLRKPTDRVAAGDPYRARATRLIGWILLAVAAVPSYLLLRNSVTVVLDYGYMGLFRQQSSDAVTWALSCLLIPGIIFVLAGSGEHPWIQYFCLAAAVGYTAVNLFLGARGAAVMSGVSIAWVYDRVGRRIPRGLIVVLSLISLIVFALVRETRTTSGRWRLSLDRQIESLANMEAPLSSSIAEMGYTLVTVANTVSLVPELRDFDLGVSYLYGATAMIPNVGWEVHPGVAHGLLCDWVTKTAEPMVAAAGGGLGFSFIAESYLNFGWIGGPIWLGLLGYFFCKLFLQADSRDPAKYALIASFLSFFFVFARGESAMVVRGLVWYAWIPYLLVNVLSIRRLRRLGRASL